MLSQTFVNRLHKSLSYTRAFFAHGIGIGIGQVIHTPLYRLREVLLLILLQMSISSFLYFGRTLKRIPSALSRKNTKTVFPQWREFNLLVEVCQKNAALGSEENSARLLHPFLLQVTDEFYERRILR